MAPGVRRLVPLVGTRQRQQRDVAVLAQRDGQGRADRAFVAQHGQVVVGAAQFCARHDRSDVGRRHLSVADHAAQGDQQMPLGAEDRLLLRATRAKGRIRPHPLPRRTGRVGELDHRQRTCYQTISSALS